MKPRRRRRHQPAPNLFDILPPLSDEAATAMAQFLGELHLQFESLYLGKIVRYRQAHRPPPRNPDQPWLTGLLDADDPV